MLYIRAGEQAHRLDARDGRGAGGDEARERIGTLGALREPEPTGMCCGYGGGCGGGRGVVAVVVMCGTDGGSCRAC